MGDQARVLAAMAAPTFYPGPVSAVEVRETHASTVFLAGDRAYKVKKAVALPFLDYATLERRRFFCSEEVRLNRRLAPRFYLGVRSIADRDGTLALADADDAAAIEYVVEMVRVPETRTLEALVKQGIATDADIRAVARRITAFHAEAAVAGAERARPSELAAQASENLDTVLDAIGSCVDERTFAAVARFSSAWLRSRLGLLEARSSSGRIRDGHGDLRAEHVVLLDGEVVIYDCVEFDERLRQIDVASDLAFLYMDLERLGAPHFAAILRDTYEQESGDGELRLVLPFYACYRAWVRGKVACVRARQLSPGDIERARLLEAAREQFELARRFTWIARLPLVIVVCGVGASGKSAVAAQLGALSGYVHLSSDVIRKELAELRPDERAPASVYGDSFSMRTYGELAARARTVVESGKGAIVDATYMKRRHRARLSEELERTGCRILFVECKAPRPLLQERSSRRRERPEHGSDATWEVVQEQLKRFENLYDVPARDHVVIRTDRPVEEAVDAAERFVASAVDEAGPPQNTPLG